MIRTENSTFFASIAAFLLSISFVASVSAAEVATPQLPESGDLVQEVKPVISTMSQQQLNQALISKAAFGSAADFNILLERGANPKAVNASDVPVIFLAALRRDDDAPKMVAELLKRGADVNSVNPNGEIIVLEVARKGRADVLKQLINANAVLWKAHDAKNQTIDKIAAERGDKEIIDIVTKGVADEKSKLTALKSDDTLVKMVKKLSYMSCANEYLSYYMGMQDPNRLQGVSFNDLIDQNEKDIKDLDKKFEQIFGQGSYDLKYIMDYSEADVANQLDFLVSDKNRLLNGVGTDFDLNKRCVRISDQWNLEKIKQPRFDPEEKTGRRR